MTRALLMAVAFAACAASAQAQELGRLFFTPEQRAAMDARRKARVPDKPAPVPVAPVTRLDGYVKRSGGPSTVWLNGEPVPESPAAGPRIDSARGQEGRVGVPVGESGGRVGLKPGQVVDTTSGEVRDVLGDGRIQVRPQGAKK